MAGAGPFRSTKGGGPAAKKSIKGLSSRLSKASTMDAGPAKEILVESLLTLVAQVAVIKFRILAGEAAVDETRALPALTKTTQVTLEKLGLGSLPDPDAGEEL